MKGDECDFSQKSGIPLWPPTWVKADSTQKKLVNYGKHTNTVPTKSETTKQTYLKVGQNIISADFKSQVPNSIDGFNKR